MTRHGWKNPILLSRLPPANLTQSRLNFRGLRYVHRTREALRGSFNTEAKANEEADKEMSVMKSRTMVDNVRRMAQLLNTAHIQTRFVEFADEGRFSGIPAALGRAVPFAPGDDLPTN